MGVQRTALTCSVSLLVIALSLDFTKVLSDHERNWTHYSRHKRSYEVYDLTPILPRKLYETACVAEDKKAEISRLKELAQVVIQESVALNINDHYKRYQLIFLFLASHRNYEIDWRFEGKKDIFGQTIRTEPVFMKQFPEPPLKELDFLVTESCGKNVMSCFDLLYYFASVTKTSKAYLQGVYPYPPVREEDIIYPFWSREALFKFRGEVINYSNKAAVVNITTPNTALIQALNMEPKVVIMATAMYYLCYYYQVDRTYAFGIVKTDDHKCPSLAHDYLAAGKKLPQDDWRNRDEMNRCAEYAFCPDVCCGYPPEITPDGFLCYNAPINPCRHIADGRCHQEYSFLAKLQPFLSGHQVNYKCDCHKDIPGFIWSMQFGICVDQDECHRGYDSCGPMQACINTPGSYFCVCRNGHRRKSDNSGECELTEEHKITKEVDFPKESQRALAPPNEPPSGFTLIDDLKLLWKILTNTNKQTTSNSAVPSNSHTQRSSCLILTGSIVTAAATFVLM